jgi:uncharacterized protein (TIGR02145 family)
VAAGNGTGPFSTSITVTGLASGATYYVRAYATNSMFTAYGNEAEIVIDIDGNVYYGVTIGAQVWMIQNLKTTKYRDGTSIPVMWAGMSFGGYVWFNNDISFKNPYGALYNWYAVNTGKLCPTGWHVPTDTEWTTLTNYLGGGSVAGGELKEAGTSHWISPNTGATNSRYFTALPGGYRLNSGAFVNVGFLGCWWSTTVYNTNYAWVRVMQYNTSTTDRFSYEKRMGNSVRCLKD